MLGAAQSTHRQLIVLESAGMGRGGLCFLQYCAVFHKNACPAAMSSTVSLLMYLLVVDVLVLVGDDEEPFHISATRPFITCLAWLNEMALCYRG